MIDAKNIKTAILGLILLILFVIFLAREGSEILKSIDVNVHEFMAHKATSILIFLIIGITWRLLLVRINRHDLFFMPEAITVAATVGLMIEVPHIQGLLHAKQRFDINGEWNLCLEKNNQLLYNGKAQIEQHEKGSHINISGYFSSLSPKDGVGQISFITLVGTIEDNGTFYFIYRNINSEEGVARGNITEPKPSILRIKYNDLYGYDKNDDPQGELVLIKDSKISCDQVQGGSRVSAMERGQS